MGRKVSEYNDEHIREVFCYSYRIIYLLKEDTINIITVIHGSRLLPDDPQKHG